MRKRTTPPPKSFCACCISEDTEDLELAKGEDGRYFWFCSNCVHPYHRAATAYRMNLKTIGRVGPAHTAPVTIG